ncbi:hypothetical protein H632_c829p2 [Helicosporidium sp. ATCC 50920]|nr:hypothetical protein H632_c829p2 [Helicosporidium sp. ATCC 50920]|eukprot:KDD75172.1 hypothetical protein H632_c829p2 [Helicosporidium sp. ATCC 50920]
MSFHELQESLHPHRTKAVQPSPSGAGGSFMIAVLVLLHVICLGGVLLAWLRTRTKAMARREAPKKVHCVYEFALPVAPLVSGLKIAP